MDLNPIASASRVKEIGEGGSRFWARNGFAIWQIIEAACGDNWVCYVCAKSAAGMKAAAISEHRGYHRPVGGDGR